MAAIFEIKNIKLKSVQDAIKKLEQTEQGLRQENIQKVLNRLGVIFVGRLKMGFSQSKDPYGNEWKSLKNPSKKRGGETAKPLLDRGRLVGSLSFVVQGDQLIVSTNVNYAEYHQNGTSDIPQRMFLPDSEKGLPDSFERDISQALDTVLRNMI